MDSRKDMTKRLIADGFKALMLRYPFEKISIMMITNEAGIRRPSFYNHFQDKYDLLAWIVETDVIAPAGEPLRRGDGVGALRTIFAGRALPSVSGGSFTARRSPSQGRTALRIRSPTRCSVCFWKTPRSRPPRGMRGFSRKKRWRASAPSASCPR